MFNQYGISVAQVKVFLENLFVNMGLLFCNMLLLYIVNIEAFFKQDKSVTSALMKPLYAGGL